MSYRFPDDEAGWGRFSASLLGVLRASSTGREPAPLMRAREEHGLFPVQVRQCLAWLEDRGLVRYRAGLWFASKESP